jgi:hypothetical protein
VLIAATAGPATGAFESASRAGMGDVITCRNGRGSDANVAFRAIPTVYSQPHVIPLPLGLVQLAASPPVFDPDHPDFSASTIAGLFLNPPYDLRLTSPPNGDDAEIMVRVAEDEIILDLGSARSLVPEQGFEHGGRFATDLFNSRVGSATISVTPQVSARGRLALSEDFTSALREAAPLTSSGTYFFDENVEAQAAMAIGVTYARQVSGEPLVPEDEELTAPGDAEDELEFAGPSIESTTRPGLRVFVGGGVKYLLGLGYFGTDGRLDLIPTEPLLDPDDPTDVEFAAIVRTASPNGGLAGQGYSLDLGIAALYGEAWEMGLGVTDLAASMQWRGTIEQVVLEQSTGRLETTVIARGERFETRLTPQIMANLARHWGEGQRTTLATNIRHGVEGTSWHLGAQTHLNRFVLRGGTILDGQQKLQGTGGTGVRLGPVGFDLSLATVSANLAGDRALMLSTAIVLY